MPLKNCSVDPGAYIEIYIKAKVLDQVPNNPSTMRGIGNSSFMQMPVIEERESECDVKEVLERKEKDYLKNIERLEYTLEDLRRAYE